VSKAISIANACLTRARLSNHRSDFRQIYVLSPRFAPVGKGGGFSRRKAQLREFN
jgi:hypothetical protein